MLVLNPVTLSPKPWTLKARNPVSAIPKRLNPEYPALLTLADGLGFRV